MGEMHTPYSSRKRLLSLFNGFIVMSGGIFIGLDIYVKFRGAVLARVLGLSSAYLLNTGCLCPAVGCLLVLLGFAGWYGATRENRGTLLFCFLSTVTILIVEIIVVAVVLALFHICSTLSLFIYEVQEMALEHIFSTLRKNYRGYEEPDDCSTGWDLVTEKTITKTQSFNLSGGSLEAAVIQLPGILATSLLFIKRG
ncbi:tetraspanin-16 [Meles meles]|uniref:tetraspanin-16 n=1 Tax=Meles meles TaxID=9662 RepID=UPI001E69AA2B|nr:tetraspanin-16 [Meles meles]